MNSPLVSFIMAAYNAENFISEAIESILNQSYSNFELIVIDDGSEDSTVSSINSFKDDRIKLIRQANQGPATARNKGLKIAEGKYIAIQDADDISERNRLKIQVDFLEKQPQVVAVGSSAKIIDKDRNYIYTKKKPGDVDKDRKWINTPFIHSSVMFRSNILDKVGMYPELPNSEEIVFFYKMSKYGLFKNIKEPLIKYRIHPESFSRNNKKLKRFTSEVLENYFNTGQLNEGQIRQIKKNKSEYSNEDRIYHYHVLLAKKYLWNNYNSKLSRRHLAKAIKGKRDNKILIPFFLYLMTFMSEKTVVTLYNIFKQ